MPLHMGGSLYEPTTSVSPAPQKWDEWDDVELKLDYRRALVWNSARPNIPRPQISVAPRQNQTKDISSLSQFPQVQ